jgi:hypothetical protein
MINPLTYHFGYSCIDLHVFQLAIIIESCDDVARLVGVPASARLAGHFSRALIHELSIDRLCVAFFKLARDSDRQQIVK